MTTDTHVHSTAKLIEQIEALTAELADRQAEKAALEAALGASIAYGQAQHARAERSETQADLAIARIVRLYTERDAAQAALRARITEVHTLNARLLIAQGGQI
jgi:hypothetical protein